MNKDYLLDFYHNSNGCDKFCPAILYLENKESYHLLLKTYTFNQFIYNIRKTRKLPAYKGFFFLIDNKMVTGTEEIGTIYERLKDEYGLLHINVIEQSTFG